MIDPQFGGGFYEGPVEEQRTRGGIILPPKPRGRAWFKLTGEPAQLLVETPIEFARRWTKFMASDDKMVVFHDFAYGTPIFFFRNAIDTLAYIGITHPTTAQGRTVPGSIYAGECPCAEWGGTCPPLEAKDG